MLSSNFTTSCTLAIFGTVESDRVPQVMGNTYLYRQYDDATAATTVSMQQ